MFITLYCIFICLLVPFLCCNLKNLSIISWTATSSVHIALFCILLSKSLRSYTNKVTDKKKITDIVNKAATLVS